MTELKVGQIRLEEGQARLEGRIGDVAGTAYERRIVRHSRSIVGRYLGIKRAKILRSINVTEHETLDGLMETATEAGSVTDEQGYELDLADIIIAGSGAPGGRTTRSLKYPKLLTTTTWTGLTTAPLSWPRRSASRLLPPLSARAFPTPIASAQPGAA